MALDSFQSKKGLYLLMNGLDSGFDYNSSLQYGCKEVNDIEMTLPFLSPSVIGNADLPQATESTKLISYSACAQLGITASQLASCFPQMLSSAESGREGGRNRSAELSPLTLWWHLVRVLFLPMTTRFYS